VLLSLAGGVLGLVLAVWWSDFLVALGKKDIRVRCRWAWTGHVLGFTFVVSLLTGIVFGLVPAIHSSKTQLTETLKEGGRGSGEERDAIAFAACWSWASCNRGHTAGRGRSAHSKSVAVTSGQPGIQFPECADLRCRRASGQISDREAGAVLPRTSETH